MKRTVKIRVLNESVWESQELRRMVRAAFNHCGKKVVVRFTTRKGKRCVSQWWNDLGNRSFTLLVKLPAVPFDFDEVANNIGWGALKTVGINRWPVKTPSYAEPLRLKPVKVKVKVAKVKDERTPVQRRADSVWKFYQKAKRERELAEKREKRWLTKVRYYEKTLDKTRHARGRAQVDAILAETREAINALDIDMGPDWFK